MSGYRVHALADDGEEHRYVCDSLELGDAVRRLRGRLAYRGRRLVAVLVAVPLGYRRETPPVLENRRAKR